METFGSSTEEQLMQLFIPIYFSLMHFFLSFISFVWHPLIRLKCGLGNMYIFLIISFKYFFSS